MQTYTVHAVVDQQLAKAIAFHEAVSKGLIDADSGEYVNNVTREKIPADIAISKGENGLCHKQNKLYRGSSVVKRWTCNR